MNLTIFPTKKTRQELSDFNAQWVKSLREACLPQLREAVSSSAADSAVDPTTLNLFVLRLSSYYQTLNRSANANTIIDLLFPPWLNSHDMPMLFLGHIHPYLLTILLRSFIDREVKDTDFLDLSPDLEHSLGLSVDHEHSISPAWTNTDDLKKRIGEIECEMQPTLTSLVDRVNQAQIRYIGKWVSLHSHSHGANQPKIMDDEDDLVKELVSVLREANGLRTKVLDAVVKATTPHQKALFLEALCKFLARFTYEFQVAVPVTTHQQQQPPPRLEPATETYCIFVGDLSLDITDRVLLEVFRARFPSTKAARVPFDHFKGHNKGYGFVGFTDQADQLRAISEMNGAYCTTRPMRIGFANNSSV